MPERYWLVHPNGARQLVDPSEFDIARLSERLQTLGGELVVESDETIGPAEPQPNATPEVQSLQVSGPPTAVPKTTGAFEPPVSSLSPLFRSRLERIHSCKEPFTIEMNTRPTVRVLGGYYRRRKLVRIYTHDRGTGRRPLEELFDTFLHEVAHHLEYTEPETFDARRCERVRGRMHSPLFWQIFGELKRRWLRLQHPDNRSLEIGR